MGERERKEETHRFYELIMELKSVSIMRCRLIQIEEFKEFL